MTQPYAIPRTYRPKCAPDLHAVASTPGEWTRHLSEQEVLAIGLGAPVDPIGQYVFSDGSEKHAVTVGYLLEDTDAPWMLVWACDDHAVDMNYLTGHTQCHFPTHDEVVDALRECMAGIEEHAPNPHYAVETVVPDDNSPYKPVSR